MSTGSEENQEKLVTAAFIQFKNQIHDIQNMKSE
jgi:hypothetical protein